MKKNYEKNFKRIYKKMDLRVLLLSFNFFMIYIIHKILVVIKNHLNYLKDIIFDFFLKKLIGFYFF